MLFCSQFFHWRIALDKKTNYLKSLSLRIFSQIMFDHLSTKEHLVVYRRRILHNWFSFVTAFDRLRTSSSLYRICSFIFANSWSTSWIFLSKKSSCLLRKRLLYQHFSIILYMNKSCDIFSAKIKRYNCRQSMHLHHLLRVLVRRSNLDWRTFWNLHVHDYSDEDIVLSVVQSCSCFLRNRMCVASVLDYLLRTNQIISSSFSNEFSCMFASIFSQRHQIKFKLSFSLTVLLRPAYHWQRFISVSVLIQIYDLRSLFCRKIFQFHHPFANGPWDSVHDRRFFVLAECGQISHFDIFFDCVHLLCRR